MVFEVHFHVVVAVYSQSVAVDVEREWIYAHKAVFHGHLYVEVMDGVVGLVLESEPLAERAVFLRVDEGEVVAGDAHGGVEGRKVEVHAGVDAAGSGQVGCHHAR